MAPARVPSEVTDGEWTQVAERATSLRDLFERLGLGYSSAHNHLRNHPELEQAVKSRLPNGGLPNTTPRQRTHFGDGPMPEVIGAGPRPDTDVDAIIEEAASRFDLKAARAEKKEHNRVVFPYGPVALFFLGDQHIGNMGTDVKRMFREQEQILETPGSYVWQMGDTVDNFIVRSLMGENMKPSLAVWDQWALARHYLMNFNNRLVASCGGNHDAWTMKMTGIDYRRDICPSGVLYDGDEIRASVWVGEHEFRVWSRHKWAGSSMYNPTHGLERAARFDSAKYDLYVGAHVHKGAMAREFVLDRAKKMAILTGAYKIHDDYAVEKGFPHHDSSTAVGVVLHDDGSYFACSDVQAVLNYMQAVYPGERVA